MRYMMLLSGTNPSTPPPPELFEAIMKLGGDAAQAGVLLDTAGLLPSAGGARVSLAGGKVTYLDGHIANTGNRTVTGITVQVLFRNVAQEVAQNESQPMKFIRIREPYIDVEPVSAAPLKPGAERDFRLIFDAVTPDWDGAYPQIRLLHVQTQ